MRNCHVAFILESAYGHITPSLGIALELLKRGHSVSYAVSKEFAKGIAQIGATANVYDPLDYRVEFIPRALEYQGRDRASAEVMLWKEYEAKEIQSSLAQLRDMYRDDRPSIIVYDLRNLAGRSFALENEIPKVEHSPMTIENCGRRNILDGFYDEERVMISLPRYFQRGAEALDSRFTFTGFCADGRALFFDSWRCNSKGQKIILVAGTTAGLSQLEFFRASIRALSGIGALVVLSVAQTDVTELGPLPSNFLINQRGSNFSIVRQCSLFIGQGGQGSTLEALYWGVPTIIIPPNSCDHTFIGRVIDLGLGIRMEPAEASPENLRRFALMLLGNCNVRSCASDMRKQLEAENGSAAGADFIERVM